MMSATTFARDAVRAVKNCRRWGPWAASRFCDKRGAFYHFCVAARFELRRLARGPIMRTKTLVALCPKTSGLAHEAEEVVAALSSTKINAFSCSAANGPEYSIWVQFVGVSFRDVEALIDVAGLRIDYDALERIPSGHCQQFDVPLCGLDVRVHGSPFRRVSDYERMAA